jgi:hypothetical protein
LSASWPFHDHIASIVMQTHGALLRNVPESGDSDRGIRQPVVKFVSLDFYSFAALANDIIRHPVHSIRKSSAARIVNADQSVLGGSVIENSAVVL